MGHRALHEAVGPPGRARRAEGPHAVPGTAMTPDADLPVVRLYAQGSTDWYIELLTTLDATDERDRAFARVVLDDGGQYALASFRGCC